MKAIKQIMQGLLWLLFLLIPVIVACWLITKGYPWWVGGLSGLGVLLIFAFLFNFFTIVAARIKEKRSKK